MESVYQHLVASGAILLVPLVVQMVKSSWPAKWGELSSGGVNLITWVTSLLLVGGYELTANWPLPTALAWYQTLVLYPIYATLVATGAYEVVIKTGIRAGMAIERKRALRQQNLKNQTPPE